MVSPDDSYPATMDLQRSCVVLMPRVSRGRLGYGRRGWRNGHHGGFGAARLVEIVPVDDPARRTDLRDAGAGELALTLRCGRTLRFPAHVDDDVLRRLIATVESM